MFSRTHFCQPPGPRFCEFVPGLWRQDGPSIEPCRNWGCIVYTQIYSVRTETLSRQRGTRQVVIQTAGKMGLKVQEVSDGKPGSRPALSPMNQNFSCSK